MYVEEEFLLQLHGQEVTNDAVNVHIADGSTWAQHATILQRPQHLGAVLCCKIIFFFVGDLASAPIDQQVQIS